MGCQDSSSEVEKHCDDCDMPGHFGHEWIGFDLVKVPINEERSCHHEQTTDDAEGSYSFDSLRTGKQGRQSSRSIRVALVNVTGSHCIKGNIRARWRTPQKKMTQSPAICTLKSLAKFLIWISMI